jgi:acid stress chaperone HdeB
MIKSTWSGLICALLMASIAQAQTTIDVAKITCEQFVLISVTEPEYIAIWLSGYYHGKRNSTVIDVQQVKDYARKVKTYCLYNGKGGTLMEAIEKVLQ